MFRLRDPIHGFIELSELELRIVDSAPFQRLRNIKQLATTYLVYHGAEHTRFGHSLGVMHLTSRAFVSAISNYERDCGKPLFSTIDAKWYEQILRLIGLTHDLGHAPFSHGSEALFDDGLKHEDFTRKIICETEIADIITEIGEEFCQKNKVGEEYRITPQLLWSIYGEKNPESNPDYFKRIDDFKFLRIFMDSELDCDKMDYLLRDSYYCGVNYGRFDLNRLIDSLTVYYNPKQNIKQLAVLKGGVHAFEEFVIARYFMFIQVYFHKTRRYLDKLLVNCIKEVLSDKPYPSDVNEYLLLNDDVIVQKIFQLKDSSQSANDFINRRVMSCVYETHTHYNKNTNSIDQQLYRMIKREIQKIPNCIIEEDEANKMAHKIPIMEQYDADSGKGIPIIWDYLDKPTSIADESILLSSLIEPISVKRIYVDKEHAVAAKKIIKTLLAEETE
ncbi:MAG: HD domain-containing protein [Anaerolineaceae bacterium]|nr:HD domain-containing protein [Anaerolineaceae bacterium]